MLELMVKKIKVVNPLTGIEQRLVPKGANIERIKLFTIIKDQNDQLAALDRLIQNIQEDHATIQRLIPPEPSVNLRGLKVTKWVKDKRTARRGEDLPAGTGYAKNIHVWVRDDERMIALEMIEKIAEKLGWDEMAWDSSFVGVRELIHTVEGTGIGTIPGFDGRYYEFDEIKDTVVLNSSNGAVAINLESDGNVPSNWSVQH
jgi:hypothetical protein